MGRTAQLTRIPDCDVCQAEPAVVDCQTKMGPWAYLCKTCRPRYSVGGHLPLGKHALETPIVARKELPKPTIGDIIKAKAEMRKEKESMQKQ